MEIRGHAVKKPKQMRIEELKLKLTEAEENRDYFRKINGIHSSRFFKRADELKKQLQAVENKN